MRELAEIGGDPFAPELFGHGGGRAAAAEKVGHEIAFVAAGFDDAFEQGFGLLRGIAQSLRGLIVNLEKCQPKGSEARIPSYSSR